MNLKRFLWLVVLLSLVPASVLVVRRVRSEGSRRTVTMVMDGQALAEQAAHAGLAPLELARRYQALGLNGVALYEDSFETAAEDGRVLMMTGAEARLLALALGEDARAIPANSTLVSGLEPGIMERIVSKNMPEPKVLQLGSRTWYAYPGDGRERPAGPDQAELQQFAAAGFDIAYRPRNYPNLQHVGEDYPEQAHYLIYNGLQVAGHPDSLSQTVAASQDYITGIIEGTEQDGMAKIASKVPSARLLSFNQDYINQKLTPQDLIDKYLLAVNERNIRILYLRPYTEEQLGNMISNTERLVAGLSDALEAEGFALAPLQTLDVNYETSSGLRALSAAGVVAALGLLALLYPGVWGPLVALAVFGLGLVAGRGFGWDAFALAAALTFPVLGYGYLPSRLQSLGLATLISLAGAALLSAVGSDRPSMMAITPFAGVGATLVVPPLLYLFCAMLRVHRPVDWIAGFWRAPIRLGDVALVLVGLAALAVVFLRRGNFPVIGVSQAELALRDWLSDLFVRPRFKELLGHPMAVLGLTQRGWPAWMEALFMTGGVVAQASILNSFSHYHTPLLISLQRTLIALALGLVIGLVLWPLVRLGTGLARRWLATAHNSRPSGA